MDARTFVQLGLLALGGKVQGKTKLQKSMYFLGLMTGCLDDLGYRAHYYGPYSEDIAEAMDWLRIIGAVDQSSSGVGTVDPSGFEIRRYDYRLNSKGNSFAQSTAGRHQALWQKVQKAAESPLESRRYGLRLPFDCCKDVLPFRPEAGTSQSGGASSLSSRFVDLEGVRERPGG